MALSGVSVFPTDCANREDHIFLHLVFPRPSMKPGTASVLRVDSTNKTKQRLTAKAQWRYKIVAEIYPHSQEVLALNLNGFIFYKKHSKVTSNSHVRSAPSAGHPAHVHPAELTVSLLIELDSEGAPTLDSILPGGGKSAPCTDYQLYRRG